LFIKITIILVIILLLNSLAPTLSTETHFQLIIINHIIRRHRYLVKYKSVKFINIWCRYEQEFGA